jgi:uncharacterized protein YukE
MSGPASVPSSNSPISVEQQALASLGSTLSSLAGDLTPVAATLSQWNAGSTSMKNGAAAAAFDRVRTVWTKELQDQTNSLESLAGGVQSAGVSYTNNDASIAGSLSNIVLGGIPGASPPSGSGSGK